jgi:hypothetical protein
MDMKNVPVEVLAAQKHLGPAKVEFINSILQAVAPHVKTLMDRVTKLEAAQAAWVYRGVWGAEQQYVENNWVTHAGSLWHAEQNSLGVKPGEGAAWKIGVKRGQR